jgi:serine protease AprX
MNALQRIRGGQSKAKWEPVPTHLLNNPGGKGAQRMAQGTKVDAHGWRRPAKTATPWRKRGALASVSAVALMSLGLAGATPASASSNETLIITGAPGVNVLTDLLSLGGDLLQQFTIINGVEATLPALLVPLLEALPGINVTPDLAVSVQSTTESTGPHTPSDAFLEQTGADALASQGDIGQGVTVAVLDTGIDNLPDFSGRLIGGVDLTGAGNPFEDSYGHGTFVAGLIAGDGASSNGQYSGEAPGADLVSIKAAGATGTTDIATVIEGVQWAVANEARYHIRVLNMSLGFQPVTSTVLNPLDMAVEQAWNSGIAVVTAAGNAGPFNGTILSPGDDPLVITVGAVDDMAQPVVANDEMTNFSSVGPTSPDGWAKPDLVAPGRSVVSLAAPGSTVYEDNPSARIGAGNFVGSGTSFSAAITSGAAALLLEHDPSLTPNEVKARLLGTTNPGPVGNPFVDGHGVLDASAAVAAGPMDLNQSTVGILAAKLGGTVQLSPTGPADSWNTKLWTGAQWTAPASSGPTWKGSAWSGSAWNGFVWSGSAWSGSAWSGSAWSGSAWSGSAWSGSAWSGSAWSGSAWSGSAWSGSGWD